HGNSSPVRWLGLFGIRGDETQREPVVAETQAGGRRAVVEDMALVAAAAPAMVLGPRDGQLVVDPRVQGAFDRGVEAGPARAALVLRRRCEQRCAASRADVNPPSLLVVELAAAGPFGGFLAKHLVHVGRQHLGPFTGAALDALVRVGKRHPGREQFAQVPVLASGVLAHGWLPRCGHWLPMVTPPAGLSG